MVFPSPGPPLERLEHNAGRRVWAVSLAASLFFFGGGGCGIPAPAEDVDLWLEAPRFELYSESFDRRDDLAEWGEGTGAMVETLGVGAWTLVPDPPEVFRRSWVRRCDYGNARYPVAEIMSLSRGGEELFGLEEAGASAAGLGWQYREADYFHPGGLYVGSRKRFAGPSDSAPVVVRYWPDSDRLVRHEWALASSSIEDFARREVTVGDVTRPAYYVPGESSLAFDGLQWSSRARLDFGVAVLGYGEGAQGGEVEFEVLFVDDRGRERSLFRTAVQAVSPISSMLGSSTGMAWQDVQLELPRAGAGRIVLATHSEDTPSRRRAAWSRPVIRARGDENDALPNVLLIVVDTLRRDHLGHYGYSPPTSPTLDSLALHSTRYDAAVSQSSWTRPAMASLLASVPPRTAGILAEDSDHRLASSFETLAEVLSAGGYRTGAIVANVHLKPYFGLHQGFADHTFGMWRADELTDAAIRWIDRDVDGPFFLYLHYIDPHSPYRAHSGHPFDPGYGGRVVEDPQAVYGHPGVDPGEFGRMGGARGEMEEPEEFDPLSAEELGHMVALYDGEIRFTDSHLGRLFMTLREQELDDRTIVIFTSDHGEEFRDHGGYYHGYTLYGEQVSVPLLVHLPGQDPGAVGAVVRSLDVAPTVALALGIAAPESWRGQPLPASDDRSLQSGNRGAISETWFRSVRRASFRRGDRKVVWDQRRDLWACFDLARDPLEQNELGPDHFGAEMAVLRAWLDTAAVNSPPEEAGSGGVSNGDPQIDAVTREQLRALGYLD